MQHIQDKEFDQLFKDRFEEAEMEPSMNLWDKIEKEIEPKRKHAFPVYWMAAAAVIGVIAVGLIFNRQQVKLQAPVASAEHTQNTQPSGNNTPSAGKNAVSVEGAEQGVTPVHTASAETPSVANRSSAEAATQQPANTKSNKEEGTVLVNNYARTEVSGTKNNSGADVLNGTPKKDLNAMQPNKDIARLDTKDALVKERVIDAPKTHAAVTPKENVIVMASTDVPLVTPDEVSNENDQADKRGIRNVGDLINYVVDKVDKREDKFIEFRTDDDDNSSLIGINIGMLKFRHKKQK